MPARLGVHGCSAGSTVALEFAAGRPDVRAVWLESPYADPQEMARHYLSVATGLPPWLLDLTTRWAVNRASREIRRELGLPRGAGDLDRVDPARSLARRARPGLSRVRRAGRARSAALREAASRPRLPPGSSVWRAAKAGHCHHEDEAEKVMKDEYERRWTEFFEGNLPV